MTEHFIMITVRLLLCEMAIIVGASDDYIVVKLTLLFNCTKLAGTEIALFFLRISGCGV